MRNILGIILLACVTTVASAQQVPLTSQYMFNNYLLNPAEAGSVDYMPFTLSARVQWAGIEGAPKTQFFSTHSKITKEMGLGGFVYRDETGPISEQGIQLSYAYHLSLSRKEKISFGLAGQWFFYNIDQNYLNPYSGGDAALNSLQASANSLDFNLGVLYYTDKYKVGISTPQLLQNSLYNSLTDNYSPELKRHYYLYGEFQQEINNEVDIVPSTLLKYVAGSPVQFDVNVKALYLKKYWAGISYRYNNAMVAMVGLSWEDWSFGYSFDYSLNNINDYTVGAHEIFLTYNLVNKQRFSRKRYR